MTPESAALEASAAIAYAKLKSHFPAGFFDKPDSETMYLMCLAMFSEGVGHMAKLVQEAA
jgi:hypothetical protein